MRPTGPPRRCSLPPAPTRTANERTFLHWMNTSVTIGSIAAALSGAGRGGRAGRGLLRAHAPLHAHALRPQCCCPHSARACTHPPARTTTPQRTGVAGHAHRHWGNDYTERAVVTRIVALAMLALSILMAIWAGQAG